MASQHKKFGLPVREAKEVLTIPLLQVDIEKALEVKTEDVNDKQNFLSCVIAQAVTRVGGAERVAIQRSVAYVAFPGDKHTKRYEVDDKSRDVLERWDRGERIVEGVALKLTPPSPRRTRKALAESNRRYNERHPGWWRDQPKTDRKQRPSDPLHGVVRNGNLVDWK